MNQLTSGHSLDCNRVNDVLQTSSIQLLYTFFGQDGECMKQEWASSSPASQNKTCIKKECYHYSKSQCTSNRVLKKSGLVIQDKLISLPSKPLSRLTCPIDKGSVQASNGPSLQTMTAACPMAKLEFKIFWGAPPKVNIIHLPLQPVKGCITIL